MLHKTELQRGPRNSYYLISQFLSALIKLRSYMNDHAIRKSFHKAVLNHHHSAKHTLVLDELGLMHGACRADIAVVNGKLIVFEIKSDEDSLNRLQMQVQAYNAVFDLISIVVGERYRETIPRRVPPHWGIVTTRVDKLGNVRFRLHRRATDNPNVKPTAVARLLWRDEAIEILRSSNAPAHMFRAPRGRIYKFLARTLPLQELKMLVRGQLKTRKNWRCRKRTCV